MTDAAAPGEAGAALIESVVALAAVAVLVAGGARLHRATVEARLATERAVAALVTATAAAEHARAGSGADPAADGAAAQPTPLWQRRPCDAGTPVLHEVPVGVDGTGGTDGAAGPLRVVVPPASDTVVLAVRTGGGDRVPGATVEVTGSDGTTSARAADGAGCVDLGRPPAPLRIAVTSAAGGSGGVAVAGVGPSAARRAGAAAPVPVAVTASGAVTVVLATDGVLPDAIEGGRLAWWPGGGAGGPAAAPGAALLLPEGRRGVVVGTCADARAGGSAAAVDVAAGGDAVVAVPLGHVAVERPAVDAGRRLVLRRERPCPGTGARPSLTWDLGGGGGSLLAAVPDGAWEAVVEGPDGSRLAGPATVNVSGATGVVPPW